MESRWLRPRTAWRSLGPPARGCSPRREPEGGKLLTPRIGQDLASRWSIGMKGLGGELSLDRRPQGRPRPGEVGRTDGVVGRYLLSLGQPLKVFQEALVPALEPQIGGGASAFVPDKGDGVMEEVVGDLKRNLAPVDEHPHRIERGHGGESVVPVGPEPLL